VVSNYLHAAAELARVEELQVVHWMRGLLGRTTRLDTLPG